MLRTDRDKILTFNLLGHFTQKAAYKKQMRLCEEVDLRGGKPPISCGLASVLDSTRTKFSKKMVDTKYNVT